MKRGETRERSRKDGKGYGQGHRQGGLDRGKGRILSRLKVPGKDGRNIHVGCRGSVTGSSTRNFSRSWICGSLRFEQGGRCVVSYLEDIAYAQFLRNEQSFAFLQILAYLCVAHLTEEGRSIFIQVEGCARLDDLTVVHDDDPIVVGDSLQSVSDRDELRISNASDRDVL
jgi:hypothetical protein